MYIDPDIRKAHTIEGAFYKSPSQHHDVVEKIMAKAWQPIAFEPSLEQGPYLYPFTFLPGSINEPLVLSVDDEGGQHILSNVCTHRGNILVNHPMKSKEIRCGYHGRRFDLRGAFKHMPESTGITDFPSKKDNLPKLVLKKWGGFLFTALPDTSILFEEWIAFMEQRIGWLPLTSFQFDPQRSKTYQMPANWALYCDNYLEGFHIPFVHPELNQTLDYSAYATEVFDWGVLQVGIAKEDQIHFDLPESSPDYGKKIAAYYFWLFPNLMFNFYPWGLSLNIVHPISVDQTEVIFHSYVWKEELLEQGAGGDVDTVELQDEAIVENVQKGVRARLYHKGRYAPRVEQGVHRFHQLLTGFLA